MFWTFFLPSLHSVYKCGNCETGGRKARELQNIVKIVRLQFLQILFFYELFLFLRFSFPLWWLLQLSNYENLSKFWIFCKIYIFMKKLQSINLLITYKESRFKCLTEWRIYDLSILMRNSNFRRKHWSIANHLKKQETRRILKNEKKGKTGENCGHQSKQILLYNE